MKIKEFLILAAFVLGMMAIAYLMLVLLSLVAMLENGGSGDILDSMKNPYFAITVIMLALSTLLTIKKANRIIMQE